MPRTVHDIHKTYFISVGVEVSAIYIDQGQISSLWYLRAQEIVSRILTAESKDVAKCLQIRSQVQQAAEKHQSSADS